MLYVGSTAKSFSHRWGLHKSDLRRNCHANGYLQRAWNKYGEVNFEFETLEVCDKKILLTREQYWMDILQVCDRSIGYNLVPKAGSREGYKGVIGTSSTTCRNVYVYTIKGVPVNRFETGSHALQELFGQVTNVGCSIIWACIVGRKKSYRGYVFSTSSEFPGYKKKVPVRSPMTIITRQKLSKARLGTLKPSMWRAVDQFSKSGIFLKTWTSLSAVKKSLGIPVTNISAVLDGKRATAGGYIWKNLQTQITEKR